MSVKLIAGALAAAMALSMAALPAQAKKGGGKHGHRHHHHFLAYRLYDPICLEWKRVYRDGERRYVCVAWY